MSGTISGQHAAGVNLSSGSYADPVTNLGTITLATAGDALFAATAWTVVNHGEILGANIGGGYGISLALGGVVTNATSGVISGYDAVVMAAGTVVNESGATIVGAAVGVYVGSGATVLNAGEIRSTTHSAALLYGGGYVRNASTGTISGGKNGIDGGPLGSLTVFNSGSIQGVASDAVYLGDGGLVSNALGGTLAGHWHGVDASGVPATVLNAGFITSQLYGVVALWAGGSLTNQGSGTIIGGGNGFYGTTGASTVVNTGYIDGISGSGVELKNGGYVSNATGGTLAGNRNGVLAAGLPAKLVNAGFITGHTYGGVELFGGGSLTNLASGTIVGNNNGFYGTSAAAAVVNYGTIEGSKYVGVGLYAGGSLTNASHGVIDGARDGFLANTIAATVVNAGLITSQGTAALALLAGGTVINQAGGTIVSAEIAGGPAQIQDSGTLGAVRLATGFAEGITIEPGAVFYGLSSRLTTSQTIELAGTSETYGALSGGILTLSGGTRLHLAGSFAPGQVRVSDSGGNTFITACFAAGTRITGEFGRVPVEALRVGERVRTLSGRLAPVRWLGHRRTDLRRHPRPHDVMPVRVRAGAFGPATPTRDLVLSPDHAVFADGYLVPIRHLVNGRSIVQEPRETITYWHVELDRHDVLLAENLPCESYLDTGNRHAFEGGAALALHPDFARSHALVTWQASGCAPILTDPSAPVLRAIHTRLLAVAYRPRAEARTA